MNANWPHVRRIRVSAAAKLPKNRCFPGVRSGRARRLGEIPILIFHPAENATGPGTPARADVSLLHAVPRCSSAIRKRIRHPPTRLFRRSRVPSTQSLAGGISGFSQSCSNRSTIRCCRTRSNRRNVLAAVFAIIRRYFTSRTRASVPQEGPLRRARIRHRLREPPPNPHRPMVDRRRLPPENAGSGWPGASRVPGPCRSGGGVLR
jgi:hypothetical protein